jgi:hypothetical protein
LISEAGETPAPQFATIERYTRSAGRRKKTLDFGFWREYDNLDAELVEKNVHFQA